jgi:hypothetical protein
MINFFQNLAFFKSKNANFLQNFFSENILKIRTSVPGLRLLKKRPVGTHQPAADDPDEEGGPALVPHPLPERPPGIAYAGIPSADPEVAFFATWTLVLFCRKKDQLIKKQGQRSMLQAQFSQGFTNGMIRVFGDFHLCIC